MMFIANNTIGVTGMTGGDRIYIEFIKAWKDRAHLVLFGSEETFTLLKGQVPPGAFEAVLTDRLSPSSATTLRNFFRHAIRRTIRGIRAVRRRPEIVARSRYVYSTSDFYPDSLPAFCAKLMNRRIQWIAGYYLFAPRPFSAESPYKGRHWPRGALYWLMQRLSYFVVNRFADYVCVTSEPDVARFLNKKRDRSKIIVVQGGVDVTESEKYLNGPDVKAVDHRTYDACFVGRFHYQKGVLELIDIWRAVTDRIPRARLAMIGCGALEADVRHKVAQLGLAHNVDLLGFKDGLEKYEVFKESKIVLHPATYDSGGMAAAEAMAWGLPGVSFDLPALKTYYPQGMLKAKRNDVSDFAVKVVDLLEDRHLYETMARDARRLILDTWDWSRRTDMIYEAVVGLKARNEVTRESDF